MISTVKVSTIYECSLERAFKTPMLCDVSKVHTGYGIMPKITHVSDDENWGKPGSSKKVSAKTKLCYHYIEKNIHSKQGEKRRRSGASTRIFNAE